MKIFRTRRDFIGTTAIAGAGLGLGLGKTLAATGSPVAPSANRTPEKTFPSWPTFDQREDKALLEVLHSGDWGRARGRKVADFERTYAQMTGAKHCVATSSGTTALLTSFGALGVGPGDEVILPVYTFVATFNAITAGYALPVFVDTDPETFQIDASKIPAAITASTKVILPVHIGGLPADLDAIGSLGKARGIHVIEDACQAWVAQWRGRVVGNTSLAGCFSFQASKNLTAGEGGAIVTNDEAFADKCFNFQNQGGGRPGAVGSGRGANYRLTEFQGGLLLAQMTRLEEQSSIREQNAAYLTKLLGEISGIKPARWHDGCTRSACHLYMFRYQKEHFANLPRTKFLRALADGGVPASSGYAPLNASPHVRSLATNPYYHKVYGKDAMTRWEERNQCPVNDRLCTEAVWFSQSVLLAARAGMDRIAETIRDIQRRAPQLAKI